MLKSQRGYRVSNRPSPKMTTARLTIFQGSPIVPRESVIETPTMKRKNGKIRSVGVQPFHVACRSGG